MAGPSEISGLGGTFGNVGTSKTYGDTGEKVQNSVTAFAAFIAQQQEQKKNKAIQTLAMADQMTKMGLMPKAESILKAYKTLGVEIDPKQVADFAKGGGYTAMAKKNGQANMNPATDPTNKAMKNVQDGNPMMPTGANMKQMEANFMRGIYGRAIELNQAKQQTELAKEQNAKRIEELRGQAMDTSNPRGAAEATGALMASGEIPYNFQQRVWDAVDSKTRGDMIAMATGHESEAEIKVRGTQIGEHLQSSGYFKDPVSAMKAGDILARGGELPADLKAQMKPYSFKDLSEQADMALKMVDLGVPADQIPRRLGAAQVGGLQNALPTGMRPLALRQVQNTEAGLSIERARLGLDAARLQKEMETSKIAEARLALAEQNAANKQTMDDFRNLVELKRGGANIPEDVLTAKTNEVAKRAGLEPEQVRTFWNIATLGFLGGTKTEYKPAVDESALSGQGGKDQTPPASGILDKGKKILDSIKGASDDNAPVPEEQKQ